MHFAVRNGNELLLTTVIEIDVKTEGNAIRPSPKRISKNNFSVEEVNELSKQRNAGFCKYRKGNRRRNRNRQYIPK